MSGSVPLPRRKIRPLMMEPLFQRFFLRFVLAELLGR
jgi:hypothetical protein